MKAICCPQCGKKDTWNTKNSYRPFCSDRCRLLDFGSWSNEEYAVPVSETHPSIPDEGVPEDNNP